MPISLSTYFSICPSVYPSKYLTNYFNTQIDLPTCLTYPVIVLSFFLKGRGEVRGGLPPPCKSMHLVLGMEDQEMRYREENCLLQVTTSTYLSVCLSVCPFVCLCALFQVLQIQTVKVHATCLLA